jgi:hypothetical protein
MSALDRYLEPPDPWECEHAEECESEEECEDRERTAWEDAQHELADAQRKGEW